MLYNISIKLIKEWWLIGLDNGVEVKRNEHTNNIPELKRFEYSWDKEYEYDFSICYWRKCWGLRNDVLWLLRKRWDEECRVDLTQENIDQIIELLKSYNSENWEDSIWEWDDEEYPYSEKIKRDIENLKELRELMDKYDLEVYFYDSY